MLDTGLELGSKQVQDSSSVLDVSLQFKAGVGMGALPGIPPVMAEAWEGCAFLTERCAMSCVLVPIHQLLHCLPSLASVLAMSQML